jgi:hypothetical protein
MAFRAAAIERRSRATSIKRFLLPCATKPSNLGLLRIESINYYTAHISGRVDPDGPRCQHAYSASDRNLAESRDSLREFPSQSEGGPCATARFSAAIYTAADRSTGGGAHRRNLISKLSETAGAVASKLIGRQCWCLAQCPLCKMF